MANEFRKVTDQNGVDHPVCDDTRMTWEANAKTGVHNFLLPELVIVDAANGISYASDKGVYTLTGTASANSYGHIDYGVLPAGKYKFSGVSGGTASGNKYYMDFNNSNTRLARLFDGEAEVTLDGTSYVRVWINVVDGYEIPAGGIQFKPMLTLLDDTLEDFTQGAMTNRELTEKVQGIIDAATNAADFAAFKTAIGNL